MSLLYSIAKSLLLPPGLLLLLLGIAFFLVRGVFEKILIFITFSLFTLMTLPVVATVLMMPLERYPALGTLPPTAQAIVILSAGRVTDAPEYGGDTLDDASWRRLRYGAILQRQTGLPLYVAGGKLSEEQQTLAALMAAALQQDYGITVAGMETSSQTTWENARNTAQLLKPIGIQHVLLVSDAWHLPRAVDAFTEMGFIITPAPTGFVHRPHWQTKLTYWDFLPSARSFLLSYYAIHEHIGRVWYQLKAWQN
ncbi:hypothetical protein CKO12_01655 [Chromatium okenii]|uniref:YdcF family protein n=1 Tax=Chromatium okenii TaxID=61644 RepID=UPI0019084EDA|nr:YdcF family protein [Chromatium okenii]MBK1640603.1 hypothetical protein [Chromatium okenii]